MAINKKEQTVNDELKKELIAFLASLEGDLSKPNRAESQQARTLIAKAHINPATSGDGHLTDQEKASLLEFVLLLALRFPELQQSSTYFVKSESLLDKYEVDHRSIYRKTAK